LTLRLIVIASPVPHDARAAYATAILARFTPSVDHPAGAENERGVSLDKLRECIDAPVIVSALD
jgi:hypothetical protein